MTTVISLAVSEPIPVTRTASPDAFARSVTMDDRPPSMELGRQAVLHLLESAADTSPVNGLTHNHYKYPARFSPLFVRALIQAFSHLGRRPRSCQATS